MSFLILVFTHFHHDAPFDAIETIGSVAGPFLTSLPTDVDKLGPNNSKDTFVFDLNNGEAGYMITIREDITAPGGLPGQPQHILEIGPSTRTSDLKDYINATQVSGLTYYRCDYPVVLTGAALIPGDKSSLISVAPT
ncbi:hypothetical protein JB92DRAFT_2832532 [Gautieria morchelliformis]|nr:hypothetical protein JB92DRAFT_2832532 [Gautieria morchelliformis]